MTPVEIGDNLFCLGVIVIGGVVAVVYIWRITR